MLTCPFEQMSVLSSMCSKNNQYCQYLSMYGTAHVNLYTYNIHVYIYIKIYMRPVVSREELYSFWAVRDLPIAYLDSPLLWEMSKYTHMHSFVSVTHPCVPICIYPYASVADRHYKSWHTIRKQKIPHGNISKSRHYNFLL